MPMAPIRVVIADDHTLVRAGIAALLGGIEGVVVVAEAEDGREALQVVAALRPDIVLLDITMPGLNGLDVAERIARSTPQTRVIMLSMHANEEYVFQALHAGAAGYLLKGARIAELELAVIAVARGETYLSPAVARHLVSDYIQRTGDQTTQSRTGERLHDRLTSRQREILQLIAEGRTTKDIARMLELSVKTVEMHRAQLMDRLGIHDLAGLVRYAIRSGLVMPDS